MKAIVSMIVETSEQDLHHLFVCAKNDSRVCAVTVVELINENAAQAIAEQIEIERIVDALQQLNRES